MERHMPLAAGEKLASYEIISLIGAGGMGEVYRARDPRVGRDVAIKISAERFSERFEREARAIASLNHPNICTLFDVGSNYLVIRETAVERAPGSQAPGPQGFPTAAQFHHSGDNLRLSKRLDTQRLGCGQSANYRF